MTMYDPILLRSFVAVIEHGGFTRASQSLHLTQSTVSQHLRRLEEDVGHPLVDRSGTRPTTTEAGERLFGYARRLLALGAEARAAMDGTPTQETVRLGVPEDFGGRLLTPVLAAFARQWGSGLRLEVTTGLGPQLLAAYERGEYDLVLAKQRHARAVQAWREPLVWLDSRRHPCLSRSSVPVAVFPEGGLYREELFGWLDAQRRRWHVAYVSPQLASLQAAVADGLGLSLLPRRAVLPAHRVLGARDGAPAAPHVWLALHHPAGASPATLALAERLAQRCTKLAQAAAANA